MTALSKRSRYSLSGSLSPCLIPNKYDVSIFRVFEPRNAATKASANFLNELIDPGINLRYHCRAAPVRVRKKALQRAASLAFCMSIYACHDSQDKGGSIAPTCSSPYRWPISRSSCHWRWSSLFWSSFFSFIGLLMERSRTQFQLVLTLPRRSNTEVVLPRMFTVYSGIDPGHILWSSAVQLPSSEWPGSGSSSVLCPGHAPHPVAGIQGSPG
ncbi:hypothetical protein TIFTF001_048880 [Ficus carica]|uniref:Uncharacterized protein n=1 Tax=Ficus carica TaxID=3494 RepID=A0AA87Z8W5_FICCA|nr:hypothetical protein TIFTF001_048880 [Ficus carica]